MGVKQKHSAHKQATLWKCDCTLFGPNRMRSLPCLPTCLPACQYTYNMHDAVRCWATAFLRCSLYRARRRKRERTNACALARAHRARPQGKVWIYCSRVYVFVYAVHISNYMRVHPSTLWRAYIIITFYAPERALCA